LDFYRGICVGKSALTPPWFGYIIKRDFIAGGRTSFTLGVCSVDQISSGRLAGQTLKKTAVPIEHCCLFVFDLRFN
ncbi:hypothetical protein LDJ79_21515, partial [Vibrio tritonius]